MSSTPYRLLSEPAEIARVAESLRAELAIGLDTETTGLDPHTRRPRLLQVATAHEAFIFDCFRLSPEALRPIFDLLAAPAPVKIGHNVKFDAKFLMRHFGVRVGGIFDTYLASQLISAGDDGDRHGLEPVVRRFLGVDLDKTAHMSDWSQELTPEQLEYAARDATILPPLRERMLTRLHSLELMRVAQLEFDCVLAVAGMELAGVHLDVDRWRALIARKRIEHDAVAEELQRELGAGAAQMNLFGAPETINLDSPAQVRDALGRLGIELEDTREWTLQRLAPHHPVIEKLLLHRGLSRGLSSYGENILGYLNSATGRLHPDFRQIGTPTGRLTTSSPSLQQIPHTVEYRSCFRAPAGRRLIVADYSQIEMRILADIAGDAALLAAFEAGADIHRTTASQMFGLALDAVTKSQREAAKGLNYGLVYGMGADGLARRLECSVPEAQRLIDRYFAAYPQIAHWLNEAAETAVRDRQSRTIAGRLWKFKNDPQDRTELAALRRVGKNAPLQGSASDLFKHAMALLDDALLDRNAALVNSIHDELIVECDEAIADEIAELVRDRMRRGVTDFLHRVPVVVDVVVSDEWVKK